MNNKKLAYVSKKELKILKDQFNNLMRDMKIYFKDDFSLQHRLVGSGKRNLVVKHHNKGYDLDYQLMIQKEKKLYSEDEIKNMFFEYIQKKYGDEYNVENSTTAITLKKVDPKNSEIIYGYDIIICKEQKDSLKLIVRKDDGNYFFEEQKEYKNYKKNMKYIKINNLWERLRIQYLYDKEKNLTSENAKKSFFILMQSAKTVTD